MNNNPNNNKEIEDFFKEFDKISDDFNKSGSADSDSAKEEAFKEISETEYIVDGQIKLDEVNEHLNLALTSEDYDSLGGYIIGSLDRLPAEGDTVDNDSVLLTVQSMDKNRIDKIHILLKNNEA